MKRFLVFSILILTNSVIAQPYKGSIIGKVVDSKTLEPLLGVHVVVKEKQAVGAASNMNGEFIIRDLDVGTYSLQVSAVGFVAQVVTNVVVTTGRATPVPVKLDETSIEMEGVTTEGNYFSRVQAMSPVSANAFDRAEVLRLPGSIQDVQRVVQNLPGIASSTDNINELIVRGGASYENLTILDGMEIPSIMSSSLRIHRDSILIATEHLRRDPSSRQRWTFIRNLDLASQASTICM